MAQTNYSKENGKALRKPGTLERDEYLTRAKEFAPRGQEFTRSKLLDMDVISIRSSARQRESLKKHIRDNLSNDAIAKAHGVHVRTIEKILSREIWSHLA